MPHTPITGRLWDATVWWSSAQLLHQPPLIRATIFREPTSCSLKVFSRSDCAAQRTENAARIFIRQIRRQVSPLSRAGPKNAAQTLSGYSGLTEEKSSVRYKIMSTPRNQHKG
jgi:hypothetical protein